MLAYFRSIRKKTPVDFHSNRTSSLRFKHLNAVFFKLFLILILNLSFFFHQQSFAQESSIKQTEATYKSLFGLEKLKALNQLTLYYYNQQSRKALKYGRQAVTLSENIFVESNSDIDLNERHYQVLAYLQLGKVLYDRESFFESQKNLEAAKLLTIQINRKDYQTEAEYYLEEINDLIEEGEIKENFFAKTFNNLNVGEVISETSKDLTIQTEIKLAESNEKKGEFTDAINHYEKAINLLKNKGNSERISELQLKVAVLLDSLDQHEEAQILLTEAIIEMESDILTSTIKLEKDTLSQLPGVENEQKKRVQESLRKEQKNLKDLAESYAKEKDFEKSLAYYKLYQELSLKMETDSLNTEVEKKQKEGEIILLKQQKKIADLNVQVIAKEKEVIAKEKERQVRMRNTLTVIALLIFFSTLVTLYFYITKRKEHKKLTITYRDLNKTKGKLVDAEKRIVKLLTQQLSADVAQELLMNSSDKPGERRFVCIMFLDIRDFTPMAEKMSPEELIDYQNNVFGFMIDTIQQHNGNINQLLGDGFMATFGAPISHGNDCQNAYHAAIEILKEVKERSDAGIIKKTRIGIGIHAGYVVTGNVGNESRKQYSVTGNPVIIASRVEQLNKEYKTQLIITEEVYKKLDKTPEQTKPFLEVKVKGRSKPVKILQVT